MGRKRFNYNFTVPNGWEEITLEHWTEIQKAYEEDDNTNKDIRILSAILKRPYNEIEQAPTIIIEKLFQSLTFLNEQIDNLPTNEIELNDETYYINYEEELKFGEYVDVQTVIEGSENLNYGAILAILCRKKDETYNEDFKRHILSDRIKMFNEAPITKILPLINFFLILSIHSQKNMNAYLRGLIDQANLTISQLENFQEDGVGKKYFTKSQMKTLQSLKQQLSCI